MLVNGLNKEVCLCCKIKACAFGLLTEEQFSRLASNCKTASFNSKEEIIRGDVFPSHVLFLSYGLVKEIKKDKIIGDKVINIVTKNSYIALASTLRDINLQTTFVALSPIKICAIDKSTFKQIIFENGRFGFEVLLKCGQDNLNNFHKNIEINHKQIYGRVASLLIYLADFIYLSTDFENLLSREEMASMINTTRESVTRALRNFIDEGLITSNGHQIKITNIDVLKSISKHG